MNWNLTTLLLFFVGSLFAQTPTQTIRGTIRDAATTQALIGATVQLVDQTQSTVTDGEGQFRLEEVAVGRQQLQINYLGYEGIILPILLESGKEVVLNIELEGSQTGLDTVVVRSSRLAAVQPLSSQTIGIEETFRYSATFYDPARMMTLYPGVVNVNNQANAISVRGNSPNFNQWRLEGVEIVNPNHTPNAGTFSDRITQSAGGVNILSAQLLDYSTFLTSAYQAQYGNALGGILDMNLRDGNAEQHEFIGQIGLIGIDLAAEGPISKKSGASYLANYRYSTIGLLSDLGVDLGDEEIRFQDLSVNLSFPTQKAGDFTLFGIWGASDNIFITDRDSTLWEESKDQFDIIFDSRTTIFGGTHQLQVGDRGLWKTSVAISELESGRTQEGVFTTEDFFVQDQERYAKTAFHSFYNYQFSPLHQFRFGVNATQHDFDTNIENERSPTRINQSAWQLHTYLNWEARWSNRFSSTVGLAFSNFDLNENSTALEPRLSLNYNLTNKQSLHLAYGLHSQIQLPRVYISGFFQGTQPSNAQLGLSRAHHLVLGYHYALNASTRLEVEAYFQQLFDIPIGTRDNDFFSAINILEESDIGWVLANAGEGQNYGLEISLQKTLLDDYYFLANLSLFKSQFITMDNIARDTRWNGNYAFNTTGGKEWKWQKKERQMILGLNLNVAFLGGFRETPIDLAASRLVGTTVFDNDNPFAINQPNFFKTDLRIYYKRNKSKYNTTLALDIQNLTNAQNVAFQYYDSVQDEILTQFQLGLIPILTWRVEF
ncbi:MAG: TonB-dependent receptor [Bacteroidota bacterium]